MAKWKDLLSDKNTFPDDFVVSVKVAGKDETLSLGEMRAYDVESKGALTADLTRREKELQTREGNINRASVELSTILEKTAERAGLTVDELVEGKAPTRRQVAEANDLDENDPLVGKLVKEIRSMKSDNAALAEQVGKLRKDALGPMLNTYLEDFYEGQWEAKVEPKLPKGAKVTREQVMEYANKNGLKDSRGRLDLMKAARDLTYEERVAEDAERRVADLRKKDKDEQVLAAAPKPSSLGTRIKTDKSLSNEKGQTKNFDEVLNDALADTDLWRGITTGQA